MTSFRDSRRSRNGMWSRSPHREIFPSPCFRSLTGDAGLAVVRLGHAAVVTAIVLCTWNKAPPASAAERPPNIVFILADDLGWGDLGCYGHPHIRTPNLDRLARQGTLFTQFYVNSAVCSPSRTAFMTGQFPARHRIHGHLADHTRNRDRRMPDWLDANVPLVSRQLQAAGYRTAHFGKWHLGSGDQAPDPGAYGFDVHRTLQSAGPGFEQEEDEYFRARSTDLLVDEAIRFIDAHRDEPFFINLWTLVPHATLHPTDEQMEPYRRFGPRNVPYRGAAQIYYATVTALDAALGRLFRKLDDADLTDRTLIFFSSDNGPEDLHIRNAAHSGIGSPGPFRGRKRSLYEGGVRVPLIVRWPGRVPAGRVDRQSVLTAVDWLPTLCRLAGAPLPPDYAPDGEDIGRVLRGEPVRRRRNIYWQWRFGIAGHPLHHSPALAVRSGEWKLLLNPDRSRVELFRIPDDPAELRNVAKEHPDITDRLAAAVLAWHKSLPGDPLAASAGRIHGRWPGVKTGKD